ncbi:hypothetical protein SELMODRAFT_425160 [Selaginella moellendorffii]|uniref:ATPase domain-containing protein n=1 Tax=Selaginella moellendorffii TaxID=88036 RepID=D8SS71_SELML|nr:hypothetical protein SELMODRAFT_425160 [Selaginella moellendorffii]
MALAHRSWSKVAAGKLKRPPLELYHRKEELKRLDSALRPCRDGEPAALLLLLGPKESGKTTLVQEYRKRQELGEFEGMSLYVDMHRRVNSAERFARTMWESLGSSLKLTSWGATVEQREFTWHPVLEIPSLERWKAKGDECSLGQVMQGLEVFCEKWKNLKGGGRPTIFVDEANLLAQWNECHYTRGDNDVVEVLRGFVRMSLEGWANVVLVSSDDLFKRWLGRQEPMSGRHLEVANLTPLSAKDAREFLFGMLDEKIKGETKRMWSDIYAHYGGETLKLLKLQRALNSAGPRGIRETWNRLKESELADAREAIANPPKDWKTVVKELGKARDGIVSYSDLVGKVGVTSLDAIISSGLVHYRTCGQWGHADLGSSDREWPIVMPKNKAMHLVMKEMDANEEEEEEASGDSSIDGSSSSSSDSFSCLSDASDCDSS